MQNIIQKQSFLDLMGLTGDEPINLRWVFVLGSRLQFGLFLIIKGEIGFIHEEPLPFERTGRASVGAARVPLQA